MTGFDTIVISKKTKITYHKNDRKVTYSTSNVNVELEMVMGANNMPVKVENLNSKLFNDYIPHLSLKNDHISSDTSQRFSFQRKAGFTAKWDLTSEDFLK